MDATAIVLTLVVCMIGPVCHREIVNITQPVFHDMRVCRAYEPIAAADFMLLYPAFRVVAFSCGPLAHVDDA